MKITEQPNTISNSNFIFSQNIFTKINSLEICLKFSIKDFFI